MADEKEAKKKVPTAAKRLRNSKIANLRNRARLSELKTLEKAFRATVEAGDAAKANELVRGLVSAFDKAAKVGTIHANRAANKKSQFDKLLKGLAK